MRKQPQSARSKASDTQERLVARETFQYVTTNPKKYGAVSTRNERQLAKKMNSLHIQQNKRLAKLSSQIYDVKVHQWKLAEVDETTKDPRTVEEKFLASKTEDVGDIPETELKHRATVDTRGRVGKHSSSRNEEGLSLRRNRPTDISAKTRKVGNTSMKSNNGRILKQDRMHEYDLKRTRAEDSYKPIFEPSKQGVSVVHGLKDVPVRRDANLSKSYKYKSYNLMSENYLRERPKTPRETTKYIKEPRNGLGAAIDWRENLSVKKNRIGRINTRPELRPRSVQVTNESEVDTNSCGHKIHAAKQNDVPMIKNHMNKVSGRTTEGHTRYPEGRAGIYEETTDNDEETKDHEERPSEVEENWAETLKSCRYLRKPRGYETPEISIESIFQND